MKGVKDMNSILRYWFGTRSNYIKRCCFSPVMPHRITGHKVVYSEAAICPEKQTHRFIYFSYDGLWPICRQKILPEKNDASVYTFCRQSSSSVHLPARKSWGVTFCRNGIKLNPIVVINTHINQSSPFLPRFINEYIFQL